MNIRQMESYDRSAANKRYYQQNKLQSHRSSLLNNVKAKGRVPFLKSVKHYNISIFEIIQKWREYKTSVKDNVPPVKELKMKALILNMI